MVKLTLFDGQEAPPDFVNDMSTLRNMDPKVRRKILDAVVAATPSSRAFSLASRIATQLDISKETVSAVIPVLGFMALKIRDEMPLEKLGIDLSALGWEGAAAEALIAELQERKQPLARQVLLVSYINAELEGVIPRIEHIHGHVDLRVVSVPGESFPVLVPVAIAEISDRDGKSRLAFQISLDDAERLIAGIEQLRKDLERAEKAAAGERRG